MAVVETVVCIQSVDANTSVTQNQAITHVCFLVIRNSRFLSAPPNFLAASRKDTGRRGLSQGK